MLGWETDGDALVAPAVARNRDAILAVLQRILPRTGVILEVGSGSGEHAVHFARRLPAVTWQPSDAEPAALRSIVAHARGAGLANILPPVPLDAAAADWPVDHADAVVAINVIHIAPWRATGGLMAGAAHMLPTGGCLYLYGAFTQDGRQTSESNADFDADLRARDPAWGLRDIAVVAEAGRAHGLQLAEVVSMPANNLSVVFRRD